MVSILKITEIKQYCDPRYVLSSLPCKKTTTFIPIGIALTKTGIIKLLPLAPISQNTEPIIIGIISSLIKETIYGFILQNNFDIGAEAMVSPNNIIASGLIQLDNLDKVSITIFGSLKGKSP